MITPERRREIARDYYHRHKSNPVWMASLRQKDRERYHRNLEASRAKARRYYHRRKQDPVWLQQQRNAWKLRYATDPEFRQRVIATSQLSRIGR